jgi:hypothetical protein
VARFGIQSLVSSRPAARATRAATQRQATRLPLWVRLRNPLGRTGTSVICRNAQQLQESPIDLSVVGLGEATGVGGGALAQRRARPIAEAIPEASLAYYEFEESDWIE